MQHADDLAKKARCASIGTEPHLSNFIATVNSDGRLCSLCAMNAGGGCDECRMAEVVEEVISYALYSTRTAVVPRALMRFGLEQLARLQKEQRDSEDDEGIRPRLYLCLGCGATFSHIGATKVCPKCGSHNAGLAING